MAVKQITLSVPTIDFHSTAERISLFFQPVIEFFNRINMYLHSFVSRIAERKAKRETLEKPVSEIRRPRLEGKSLKKYIRPILYIVGLLVLLLAVSQVVKLADKNSNATGKVEVEKAKATQELNTEFSFPLKDNAGKELGKVKYMVEKAELMDEIIVEGKRASTVKGREFLIISLKITNEYSQAVDMNTKDYIRLSVEPNQEWLAPDIHNDPVQVQAISTKYTRVGFPINESDKNLILRVGEINGEKQEVPLTIK